MTTTTNGNNIGSVQLTTVLNDLAQSFMVGNNGIAFMRAKTITFKAQGLKPNTQYYPFFNGVYVGEFCSQTNNPQLDSDGKIKDINSQRQLKTDSLGLLVGNFYLPANTFVSGSHVFKLVDNMRIVNDAYVMDAIYGSAESIYEATTILKQQSTVVAPKSLTKPSSLITPTSSLAATPVLTCEQWKFTYSSTTTTSSSYSISTENSSYSGLPPGLTSSIGYVDGSAIYQGAYYDGIINNKPKYTHKWTYRTKQTQLNTQFWEGPKVTNSNTDLPSLINFRPSGIDSSTVIEVKSGWTKVSDIACPVKSGLQNSRSDALAQSFYIEPSDYPRGLFTTAIGVYFKTIDQTTPVTLEIREMINGLPGSNILPGASSLIIGRSASASSDATSSTIFRFETPVYLQPSNYYCFVLKSSSLGYNAWCSRLGELDVYTNKFIETQPFTGTLFKSENDLTWIPDSYEDIKFDLYKADFDTSVQGNLIFKPRKNSITNNYYGTSNQLPLSFISTTKDSNVIKVRIPSHSLIAGDKVYIEGIATPKVIINNVLTESTTGYNGIPASQLNGEHTIQLDADDDDVITFTTTSNASKTGNIVVENILNTINTVPALMPEYSSIASSPQYIDPTVAVPSTVQTSTYSIVQPTPPTILSNTSFTIYTNIQVNELMIDYLGSELDNTSIKEFVSIATGKSTAGSEIPYAYESPIELKYKDDFHIFDEPRMLAIPRNETIHSTELTNKPSAEVNIKFNSSSKDISPVINTDGMSLTVRTYKIDNQNDEITDLQNDSSKVLSDFNDPTQNSEIVPGEGKAAAKYKSTINTLDKTYNKIVLYVTGICPEPAVIDAYIRTSTDDITHIDQNWSWMPINGEFGNLFDNSPNKLTMTEWIYTFTTPEPFSVFDIKLVMRSTNNSIVPKIFGVRTIAFNG